MRPGRGECAPLGARRRGAAGGRRRRGADRVRGARRAGRRAARRRVPGAGHPRHARRRAGRHRRRPRLLRVARAGARGDARGRGGCVRGRTRSWSPSVRRPRRSPRSAHVPPSRSRRRRWPRRRAGPGRSPGAPAAACPPPGRAGSARRSAGSQPSWVAPLWWTALAGAGGRRGPRPPVAGSARRRRGGGGRVALSAHTHRRFGGMTGDVLGAANEVAVYRRPGRPGRRLGRLGPRTCGSSPCSAAALIGTGQLRRAPGCASRSGCPEPVPRWMSVSIARSRRPTGPARRRRSTTSPSGWRHPPIGVITAAVPQPNTSVIRPVRRALAPLVARRCAAR